jgi:hypothetical protein
MWRRTFAGVSVQAWQQLSGANVMMYYVVYIFDMAGFTGNVGLTSSGVQYAVFIIGTFVSISPAVGGVPSDIITGNVLLHRQDRSKTTLNLRSSRHGYLSFHRWWCDGKLWDVFAWRTRRELECQNPRCVQFEIDTRSINSQRSTPSIDIKIVSGSPAYTVIAFVYILVLIYSLTLAPIAWVYAAEIWSLETRATGMSLASIGNW